MTRRSTTRASTRSGAAAGGRGRGRGETRSGPRAGTRSGTRTGARTGTRSGDAVRGRAAPGGGRGLLIGGLALGVVTVVAILAIMSSGGPGGSDGAETREKPASFSDLAPKAESPAARSRPSRPASPVPAKMRPTEEVVARPASYFEKLVDKSIWARAKNKAREADEIVDHLKKGAPPSGMTEKDAKERARSLYAEAMEIGNEFLRPVEGKLYEESKNFRSAYDDIMVSWSRQMRSLSYGGKR